MKAIINDINIECNTTEFKELMSQKLQRINFVKSNTLLPKVKCHYAKHKTNRKNHRNHRRINAFARWVPALDKSLLTKRTQGMSFSRIAKQLGRTTMSCTTRHWKLKNDEKRK